MSVKYEPLAFVQNGYEQDLGEYAETTRKEIHAIRYAHEELSDWGDLAVGCAWGDYSQDELEVNWCDWLIGQRVEEFLAFIAIKSNLENL